MRRAFRCPSGGVATERTVPAEKGEEPAACPSCGATVPKDAVKTTDLVRDLTEQAARYGTKVLLVSGETDDGKVLSTAFGGLAAILRFPVG